MIAFHDTPPADHASRSPFAVADLSDSTRALILEQCSQPYAEFLRAGIDAKACESCGRSKPSRTAINAFTKILIEAGKARDFAQEMVRMLGGKSLPEAKASIEAVDRAGSLDAPGRARLWAQSLERYCREQGIQGLVIPPVLLSRAEVDEQDDARFTTDNGRANGARNAQ